jgi:ABC-2 type transport system ATP-binding protein
MLQSTALPDALTVAEQVRQFSGYYPTPRSVGETLDLCGLAAVANRRYGGLSGGQKRRVQFALAVCGRPELLIVDEPTTGLDVEARTGFWRVLRQLVAEGVGMLLTTHYLEEADALADRVVLLNAGRVIADGTPEAVKQRSGHVLVRCRTTLPVELLAGWPAVQRVRDVGRRLELATAEPEQLLRALLAADPALADIEVQRSSLDDAMLQLTREAA